VRKHGVFCPFLKSSPEEKPVGAFSASIAPAASRTLVTNGCVREKAVENGRGRPPSTLLFESTDAKLGDESELFRDLED